MQGSFIRDTCGAVAAAASAHMRAEFVYAPFPFGTFYD